MNTFFILFILIPFISSKVVETDVEQFECIANYLRDKKLLEKGFRYFVQSEELDCETFIDDTKEVWLNQTIDAMFIHSDSNEEEEEETKAFKEMYLTNPTCFHQQLMDLNYTDIIMKTYIYSKSNRLSKKLRKKYLANVERENTKKIIVTSSICFPKALFGASFEEIFNQTNAHDEEDKETDYCIRKFALDNNLIDTKAFTVELNPDNLEINFDCTDLLDDSFEELEDQLKTPFVNEGEQTRRQNRCMNRAIKNAKAVDVISRLSVLNELTLSDDVRANEKEKFIEFMSNLYKDMAEC